MTEGDFGTTIKRSREQLGLSQARVGGLVGRSPSTIRSWESGRSTPTDFSTITSLAAVLALDEFELSRAAGVDAPAPRSQLTLEQVLSEITPPSLDPTPEVIDEPSVPIPAPASESIAGAEPEPSVEVEPVPIPEPDPAPEPAPFLAEPARTMPELEDLPTRVHEPDSPNGRGRHVRLAETEVQTDPSPLSVLPAVPQGELSYLEDPSQKLLYRSRSVLTAAGVVAMFFLLLWSFREATSAIDTFWELLTGNL